MRHSILAYLGQWAVACLLGTSFLTFLCILGSDMPGLAHGQAFAVRCIVIFIMACIVGAAYLCTKHGLLPDINDPDEED